MNKNILFFLFFLLLNIQLSVSTSGSAPVEGKPPIITYPTSSNSADNDDDIDEKSRNIIETSLKYALSKKTLISGNLNCNIESEYYCPCAVGKISCFDVPEIKFELSKYDIDMTKIDYHALCGILDLPTNCIDGVEGTSDPEDAKSTSQNRKTPETVNKAVYLKDMNPIEDGSSHPDDDIKQKDQQKKQLEATSKNNKKNKKHFYQSKTFLLIIYISSGIIMLLTIIVILYYTIKKINKKFGFENIKCNILDFCKKTKNNNNNNNDKENEYKSQNYETLYDKTVVQPLINVQIKGYTH